MACLGRGRARHDESPGTPRRSCWGVDSLRGVYDRRMRSDSTAQDGLLHSHGPHTVTPPTASGTACCTPRTGCSLAHGPTARAHRSPLSHGRITRKLGLWSSEGLGAATAPHEAASGPWARTEKTFLCNEEAQTGDARWAGKPRTNPETAKCCGADASERPGVRGPRRRAGQSAH